MYNKQSCRECGAHLNAHLLCIVCKEHTSWICSQCNRIEDCTHVHENCKAIAWNEIIVEAVTG